MKLALRELELWYFLWILFLLRLLCISINLPYFHAGNTVAMSVWAGAPSWHLELLDKLQKCCSTVVLSLAASHEPLTHHQNVASLILFYRYYFVRCSPELAQLVPLCYSRGRCTCFFFFFFKFRSMQGWTATTRHGVTRKRSTKRLKYTGSWFRKNLQLKVPVNSLLKAN